MTTSKFFYNNYHKKNDGYVKKISFSNFTYYYLLQSLQKAYRLLGRKPKVLDVGCGVGTIALFLSDFSQCVVGIDLSDRAVAIANQAATAVGTNNVLFRQSELVQIGPLFDLVIATEIIEHVSDERAFLQKINTNLVNGGVLVLSTPLTDNVLVNSKLYQQFDTEVGHLRRYDEASISNLLTANGFTIASVRKTESPMRNLLYILHLDFIIRIIRGPFITWFHFLDEKLIPLLGASNIIVIAQKT